LRRSVLSTRAGEKNSQHNGYEFGVDQSHGRIHPPKYAAGSHRVKCLASGDHVSRLVSPQPRSFFVVISGCSGGGKSTLLDELGRRRYAVVAEPGRRIVQE
jgi:hypothetical protein